MDVEQAFRLELFHDLDKLGCIGKWADDMQGAAIFDQSERYRYILFRRWRSGPTVHFCMLNPATADENVDDPTVRRCIGFAKAWGYSGLEVTNLFAWRGSDPRNLIAAPQNPIGEWNDNFIIAATKRCPRTFLAWGTWGRLWNRGRSVRDMLFSFGGIYHLGLTQKGYPRHPLFLHQSTQPILWERRNDG